MNMRGDNREGLSGPWPQTSSQLADIHRTYLDYFYYLITNDGVMTNFSIGSQKLFYFWKITK
jgi:hypothetical protein